MKREESNSIGVSISCITFNQHNYIRKTLEGFISQKTSFTYEILIHDDASTDGTAEIIREYEKKYPQLFKVIYQSDNQYSKGVDVHCFNMSRAKGKYVAFCEGDDYWNCNTKLQEQYDALEREYSCSVCVHDVRCIDRDGIKLSKFFPGISLPEGIILSQQYVEFEMVRKPWLFQTSCYFIRNEVIREYLEKKPPFVKEYCVGDLPMMLFSLLKGNCYYIKKEMSCYRKNSGGMMSNIRDNNNRAIAYYTRMSDGHMMFDEYTKGRFHSLCVYGSKVFEIQKLKHQGNFREICKSKYKEQYRRLNLQNRLLIRVGCVCPKFAYWIFLKLHYANKNN